MIEIKVPQENVNDENVVILEIFFGSGSKVKSGDVLVEIETTKVSVEIEAPCDGILNHNLSKGDILPVGSLLCTIFENIEINKVYSKDSSIEENSKTTSKAFISNAAKKKAINCFNTNSQNIAKAQDIPIRGRHDRCSIPDNPPAFDLASAKLISICFELISFSSC